ncbi:c-type cytochrome [Stappia sp. ES.058]|uniref:c-type cytochrome n=1 Tax=Stappia sp. ES.058 TaxID=1881061 RepID=UPI00087D41F9|nr:c-type cytochrome [Stappia sp. ES.058]SDU10820.1 cytochrome c [Stappia sp. ES.058]
MRGSGGYALVLAAAFFVFATGDALADDPLLKQGRKIFRKCQSCHQVGVDAKHRVGPYLNNIYGRRAGTLEGYRYSRAMEAAGQGGLVWTEEALSAYLEDPKSAVHGTKMNFGGLRDLEDRRAVVAFLRQFSPGAANIPETPATVPLEDADPVVPAHILALEGDPDYGEYLSSECVTCHQADGEDKGIPSITGWPGDLFVTVLHAYKMKSRDNPVMQSIAASLSDEEIAALAAYFSQTGQ